MNRREDLQEGKKSLVIHEGLSVFRLDTRNPKLLQIYGSPALHVDVGKRALNVDFNPDGDGDFHEVSAIRFKGDEGFSIEFNADELAPVQVTANSACNVHLLHFIQHIQDHMPQLDAAGDPDLVIEFIAVDGVLHRCELSSWPVTVRTWITWTSTKMAMNACICITLRQGFKRPARAFR